MDFHLASKQNHFKIYLDVSGEDAIDQISAERIFL